MLFLSDTIQLNLQQMTKYIFNDTKKDDNNIHARIIRDIHKKITIQKKNVTQLLTSSILFNSSFEITFICAVSRNHRLSQCPNQTNPQSHCNALPCKSNPPIILRVPTASQMETVG